MDFKYNKVSGIYVIKNKLDSRVYVGSAVNLYGRSHTHKTQLKQNKHCNVKLQRFFNKYGVDNIVFEVLETCDKEKLIEREQFYIDYLNPYFNIVKTAGSTLGHKISKELSMKLSKLRKGKPFSKGRIMSDETKKKISEKAKIRPLHPNFINTSILANTGKKHTKEHREKVSEKQRKLKLSDRQDILEMLSFNIKQKEIASKYGVSQRLISMVKLGTYPFPLK